MVLQRRVSEPLILRYTLQELPELPHIRAKRVKTSEPVSDSHYSASVVLSALLEASGATGSTGAVNAENTQHLVDHLMSDPGIAAIALNELGAALAPAQSPTAGGSGTPHSPVRIPPLMTEEQQHQPALPNNNGGPVDLLSGAIPSDILNSLGDITPPMGVCISALLELQQRMVALETSTGMHNEQITVQNQIATTVRRTIRAMIVQWRDLVVRMQLAISDHDTSLRRHEEQLAGVGDTLAGYSNNSVAARLDALEHRVKFLENENSSLRRQLHAVSGFRQEQN